MSDQLLTAAPQPWVSPPPVGLPTMHQTLPAPAAVTDAVAALRSVCAAWPGATGPAYLGSAEAQICNNALGRSDTLWGAASVGVIATLVAVGCFNLCRTAVRTPARTMWDGRLIYLVCAAAGAGSGMLLGGAVATLTDGPVSAGVSAGVAAVVGAVVLPAARWLHRRQAVEPAKVAPWRC